MRIFKPYRLIALLCLYPLSGCGAYHYLTDPRVRYVTVYCVSKAQLDQLKAQEPGKVHSLLTGQADKDLETVTGSLIRVRAWGDGTLDVLGGCVDPNTE